MLQFINEWKKWKKFKFYGVKKLLKSFFVVAIATRVFNYWKEKMLLWVDSMCRMKFFLNFYSFVHFYSMASSSRQTNERKRLWCHCFIAWHMMWFHNNLRVHTTLFTHVDFRFKCSQLNIRFEVFTILLCVE